MLKNGQYLGLTTKTSLQLQLRWVKVDSMGIEKYLSLMTKTNLDFLTILYDRLRPTWTAAKMASIVTQVILFSRNHSCIRNLIIIITVIMITNKIIVIITINNCNQWPGGCSCTAPASSSLAPPHHRDQPTVPPHWPGDGGGGQDGL